MRGAMSGTAASETRCPSSVTLLAPFLMTVKTSSANQRADSASPAPEYLATAPYQSAAFPVAGSPRSF